MPIADLAVFSGFPFPCALISGEDVTVSGSSLFLPPPGTASDRQQTYYTTCPEGWSVCPLGYAVYARQLEPELKFVTFGLKVRGVSKAHGRAEGLSIRVEKEQVESCVRRFFGAIKQTEEVLQTIVSTGVHEFRNINKDLYNAIYHLRSSLEQRYGEGNPEVETAKSIEALSELIKVRSDLFDLITTPMLRDLPGGTFRIYKVFDRIRKSLWRSAQEKRLTMRMSGNSRGKADGVLMFDVIPYVVVQNAIKYAPPGTLITIHVKEEQDRIRVIVESEGPMVPEAEWKRVFRPGFRGEYARRVDAQGSGVGMFIAKRLISACPNASIEFFQRDGTGEPIRGIPFRPTEVVLEFQRAAG